MQRAIVFFMLLLLSISAACSGAAEAAETPSIRLEAGALDLGDVPNGRVVEREVKVTNAGNAPLVVETVTTSCGCTTAALDPMTIAPGGSGTLRIAFDSGAHGPDLRGELMRQVTLISNDPAQPDVALELTAVITAPE